MYRKIPQCRICRSDHGTDIDRDLLQRKSYGYILDKYADKFSAEKPLNKSVLQNHWRHFKQAVEVTAVQRVQALAPALSEDRQPHSPERQEVFEAAVQQQVDEISVLADLVHSGLDDLKRIGYKDGENEFAVLNRDRLRRNTASIVVESAKVKQMALQADEDRHRMEKGRLIFRMFQLFGRSLESCPVEYRSMVASSLKAAIRDDEEINALMKEQSNKPAVSTSDDNV